MPKINNLGEKLKKSEISPTYPLNFRTPVYGRPGSSSGRHRFDPVCQRGGDFSSLLHVQTGSGSTQSSIKCVLGAFSRGKGSQA